MGFGKPLLRHRQFSNTYIHVQVDVFQFCKLKHFEGLRTGMV